MKLKVVLSIASLAVTALALWPAGAGASPFRGVVVAKQHGMLLVASPSGLVRAIHGRASVGSRVVGGAVVGRATRARIHGIVVKRVGSTTFLSSNHHLLAVHSGRALADAAPAPSPVAPSTTTPAPGAVVDTTVNVKPSGELDEQNENQVGQVNGTLQIQATITAVGQGTVTLSVNGQSVTLSLPAGLSLPATFVGQTVNLNVSLADTGQSGDNQGDDDGGDQGGSGGGSGGGGGGGGDD